MQTHLLHTDQLGDDACSRFAEQLLFGTLKRSTNLMKGSLVWAHGELSWLSFRIVKEGTWDRSKDTHPMPLCSAKSTEWKLDQTNGQWESEKQCKDLVLTSNRYGYGMVQQNAAKTRKAKCHAQHEVCTLGRKSRFLWNQAPFRTQLAAINSRWLLSPITLPKFRLCTGVHIIFSYQFCARNAVMAHLWPTGSSDQIVEWVSCRA